MRSIASLFAESPFKPLEEHAMMVKQCADLLRECVEEFAAEEFEQAEETVLEISRLEHEADKIKNYIRVNMPRGIMMPVDRGDLLGYLREQDHVADRIEDVAMTLNLRQTKLPASIKKDLLDLTNKVCDVVDLVPLALKAMNELLDRSFMRKKETRVEEYISLLNEKEQLTDVLELKMRRYLYELEGNLSYIEFYHMVTIVKLLGKTADHAENCGDRLRLMIAKR
ncbi:MAG: TIGR00153 family protein [Euryarchaeota archaeon]|nr:TIGR00153 family protein [Euryarchaeota archaeon]